MIDIDPDPDGTVSLAAALAALGERGITRLLVEGGGRLAAALARARLVDRLVWVHAPMLIGGDGIPGDRRFRARAALADAPRFERLSTETVGDDVSDRVPVRGNRTLLAAVAPRCDRVDVPKPDQQHESQPAGK